MKNKKIIIILSCAVVLVALIALTVSVFKVRKISIDGNYATSINAEQKSEICSKTFFPLNSSIFFVNKHEIISKLELENPTIYVVNIETKFPDTLIVHTELRTEMFSVKVTEDEFYSVDKTGKVLQKYFSDPNLISVKGLSETSLADLAVGKNIQNLSERAEIYNVFLGFYACNYEETNFRTLIKRIELTDNKLTIITYNGLSVGTSFEIENPNANLINKTIYAIRTYEAISTEQKTHGVISVTEKLNNNEEFNIVYAQ